MPNRLSSPRVLFWVSAVGAVLFLVPAVIFTILDPVEGLPLYLKLYLGGIFMAGVCWSFHLERKGDKVVPQNTAPDEPVQRTPGKAYNKDKATDHSR
ncbi:MAG: hypothetical protein ACOC3I_11865 [Verrucomicrobiota bacterium]